MQSTFPTRRCFAEISTAAFEENYRTLRRLAPPEAECLAIAKADAYGHSLPLCAPAAIRAGAQWLGVTSVEEAVAARALCPEAGIVVLGGIFPGQGAAIVTHHLTPVVWDPTHFDELSGDTNAAPASIRVHLEIDTGMSRQGVSLDKLPQILARFTPGSPFALQAVMTHLYASDETAGDSTATQLARLEEALSLLRELHPASASRPQWLSVGATAALLSGSADQLAALAERWNVRLMLRLGLALYGVVPRFTPPFPAAHEPPALTAARARLRPVLTWKTRVMSVRSVPAGAEIGYNGTFIASEPMRLALIAAGYADGLDRGLSNRFSLLVRGRRAPLVGRISMDQAVLDVTEIPDVAPGDEVVLIGSQETETITAYDHAEAAGTIPWEVFTRIAARVERKAM